MTDIMKDKEGGNYNVMVEFNEIQKYFTILL